MSRLGALLYLLDCKVNTCYCSKLCGAGIHASVGVDQKLVQQPEKGKQSFDISATCAMINFKPQMCNISRKHLKFSLRKYRKL